MRLKFDDDKRIFYDCHEFGETKVIADCIGPLIDISQITKFQDVEYVRYLTEDEIAEKLNAKTRGNGVLWTAEEVRKETKKALSHSKLAVRLVDEKMVMQLCKAKGFCKIKIVSTVPDKTVFNLAKKVLINYTNQMVKYNPSTNKSNGYKALEEDDFEHIESVDLDLPGILLYYQKKAITGMQEDNSYKIAIDDDALAFSTVADIHENIPLFQEWIGGIRENEPEKRLEAVLSKRQHIYSGTDAIEQMCKNNKIKLSEYTIMDSYYVYSPELRRQLEERIEAIKHIIEIGKAKTTPICVFLAGTPGTGKSYFVKCFAESIEYDGQYPVTSLSGVSTTNFDDAIEYHVEQVYNAKIKDNVENKASIAFLDEIDTECGYFAFRFLMDAMTGSRTNDKGVTMENFKSGTVENLIWFFAGSAGATRQEFMNQLKSNERKVIDFFDRIHFDMQLPAVEESGQAILTLMSAIKTFWQKNQLPTKISIKVLLAFACTKWTSTRSIMTICRVAAAHPKSHDDEITLELFKGIDTSQEFHKQCIYINDHVEDNRVITIEWEKGR